MLTSKTRKRIQADRRKKRRRTIDRENRKKKAKDTRTEEEMKGLVEASQEALSKWAKENPY